MPNKSEIPLLDMRLSLIASFVDKCDVLADIGSDHAYIPVNLLLSGKARRAVITDINEGPLNNSRKTAAAYGVTERCEFLRGDGMYPLREKHADVITVCGMGGEVMANMTEKNPDVLRNADYFIMQPQSNRVMLLKCLMNAGFCVTDEAMVKHKHLFYHCYRVKYGAGGIYENGDELKLEFSEHLINKRDAVMKEFLSFKLGIENGIAERIKKNASVNGLEETLKRAEAIKERLERYEN